MVEDEDTFTEAPWRQEQTGQTFFERHTSPHETNEDQRLLVLVGRDEAAPLTERETSRDNEILSERRDDLFPWSAPERLPTTSRQRTYTSSRYASPAFRSAQTATGEAVACEELVLEPGRHLACGEPPPVFRFSMSGAVVVRFMRDHTSCCVIRELHLRSSNLESAWKTPVPFIRKFVTMALCFCRTECRCRRKHHESRLPARSAPLGCPPSSTCGGRGIPRSVQRFQRTAPVVSGLRVGYPSRIARPRRHLCIVWGAPRSTRSCGLVFHKISSGHRV